MSMRRKVVDGGCSETGFTHHQKGKAPALWRPCEKRSRALHYSLGVCAQAAVLLPSRDVAYSSAVFVSANIVPASSSTLCTLSNVLVASKVGIFIPAADYHFGFHDTTSCHACAFDVTYIPQISYACIIDAHE